MKCWIKKEKKGNKACFDEECAKAVSEKNNGRKKCYKEKQERIMEGIKN
jgi:hypothetical protein